MSTFRGFIAIKINSFPKVIEFENEIKKTGVNAKLVEPENIHITLKFLGDTEEKLVDDIENIIKSSIEELEPFSIQLKSVGVFPNPGYIKVVWVGIEDGGLIGDIASKIDENIAKLGFNREKRRFSPHLTVARVRSAKNKNQLLKIIEKYQDVILGEQIVDSIKLIKSELTQKGPIYTVLKDVKI